MPRITVVKLLFPLAILLIVSLACASTAPPTPTPSVQSLHTASAQTVVAAITLTSQVSGGLLPVVPTATAPALPSATEADQSETPPAHTPTAEPTATSEPAPLPTETPTVAAPAPTENPTLPPAALIQDDFSADGSGWATGGDGNRYGFGYVSGAYAFSINEPGLEIWSTRAQQYSDVIIEIDLVSPSGPEDGQFGVICRWQDSGNYYRFTVGIDGTLAITERSSGQNQDLISINPAGDFAYPLRLGAICEGTTLALYINGRQVIEVQDDSYSSGAYGLIAITKQAGSLKIAFDNFALDKP